MDLQQAITAIIKGEDLQENEMLDVMDIIMTGQATSAQIGGFLVGLRIKGETIAEITAAAKVMRKLSSKVNVSKQHLVDTCGTGGDSSGSFNISTASALVAAAAGVRVAKHGNRSVSSKSGSADVLELAGVNLDLSPEQVAKCIDKIGIGFLFAPNHHGAMKHAIKPRKELGVRTLFNVLGPLTNPAAAPFQVMGVFSQELVEPIAHVLKELGSKHVMVVHADDGMDEISVCAPTQVAELRDNKVKVYQISPADFKMKISTIDNIQVDNIGQSLEMINNVFDNQQGAARDIVALNAGAAIYVAGLADSHQQGVDKALEVIANGKAATKFQQLIDAN